MLIPYSLPLEVRGKPGAPRSWNDPIRELYPHHAEFWPADIPEHHLLRLRHLRLARKRRRLMIRKSLRWFFGGAGRLQKANMRNRASSTPCHIAALSSPPPREPATTGTTNRRLEISGPLSAAGCHGGCR